MVQDKSRSTCRKPAETFRSFVANRVRPIKLHGSVLGNIGGLLRETVFLFACLRILAFANPKTWFCKPPCISIILVREKQEGGIRAWLSYTEHCCCGLWEIDCELSICRSVAYLKTFFFCALNAKLLSRTFFMERNEWCVPRKTECVHKIGVLNLSQKNYCFTFTFSYLLTAMNNFMHCPSSYASTLLRFLMSYLS